MKHNRLFAAALATLMAASVVLGGCGGSSSSSSSSGDTGSGNAASSDTGAASGGGEAAASDDGIEKPETITIMVDGTVTTQENNQQAFIDKFKELTGIQLIINQPDHDAYYDNVGQTFASGPDNWPDVIILSSTYYAGYAGEGALWDMTDAYENSELKGRINESGQSVIDGLRIDGHLYGFPSGRGNGCVTYVKKKWLDNVGMEAPTNYDEYIKMLDAFTTGDPDGNGVDGDTYGVSAAGIIAAETPYINYLPEFYQDAFPSFVKGDDGVWYDGFTEQSFKDALNRLREAYAAGYIDKETLTNGTNDCRNKFYEDKFGVFTYWAGTWDSNLKNNLEANGLDGELVPLKPLAEVADVGGYIERTPPVWAITEACENPEGVFKYFIETMHDGGEIQTLWSYGVEDVHWSRKAEEVCGNTYAEGEFHFAESLEKPGTQYTKQHMDSMLALVPIVDDIGANGHAPEAVESQEIFNNNCRQAQLVPSTDEMAQYNGDLTTLKNSIVADVVVQGVSIDEAYQRFETEHGAEWSKMIVDSLNAQ